MQFLELARFYGMETVAVNRIAMKGREAEIIASADALFVASYVPVYQSAACAPCNYQKVAASAAWEELQATATCDALYITAGNCWTTIN